MVRGLRGPAFISNPSTRRKVEERAGRKEERSEQSRKELGTKGRVSERMKEIMRKRVIEFLPLAPQGW